MGFNKDIGGNDDSFSVSQPAWRASAPSCGETPHNLEHNVRLSWE